VLAGTKSACYSLTLLLNQKGVRVAAPTVGAIMREESLRAVRTRAWKKTI